MSWQRERGGVAANDRIAIALVGCGGMGCYNLGDFMRLPDFEIAAVCDVDPTHIEDALGDIKTANRRPEKVQAEKDFRKVLDRKDIDAVIVATPDHWHAYVLLAACYCGKDVYCEKPLSHNIVEGLRDGQCRQHNKRIVQVGTQQRSGDHFKQAIRYIHSGRLGDVSLCRTWITNHSTG